MIRANSFAGGHVDHYCLREPQNPDGKKWNRVSALFSNCEIDSDRILFLPQEWSSNGTADRGVVQRYGMSGMSGNFP